MARPACAALALLLSRAAGAVSLGACRAAGTGGCQDTEEAQLLQLASALVPDAAASHASGHAGRVPNTPGCPGLSCGAPGCPGFKVCPREDEFPRPSRVKYPQEYRFEGALHFPDGFKWGLGTAAYQVEGAYNEDGRGASIWDTFSGANTVGMPGSVCKRAPCPVSSVMGIKGATGNIANDFYHKFRQDIATMASMGVKHYRFSIAWPRIVPTGRMEDGVNLGAAQFYDDVLDELLSHGIEPIVTMYHWDLPQGLLDFEWNEAIPTCNSSYRQGWYECLDGTSNNPQPSGLHAKVVREFVEYATWLLTRFGSKVRYWLTFNEPWTFTWLASGGRGKAPNVQPWYDASVWPYVAGHNVIIAHAKTAQVFRRMQGEGLLTPEHKISITNNQDWREPYDMESSSDLAAAQYSLQGQLAWYCDPIYGHQGEHDYPLSMKMTLPYMPNFTADEKAVLKATRPDFFGLNHYGTAYTRYNCSGTGGADSSCNSEEGLPMAVSTWLFQAGWGFQKLLVWVAERYGRDLPIWVTESGWSDNTISALQAKYDTGRLMYYYEYVRNMYVAMAHEGVRVEAFLAWSLMDNYEWERGYAERFGGLWNEFNFGADPNSPGARTPIYDPSRDGGKVEGVCGQACTDANVGKPSAADPYRQTRHAKSSIMWLQWVWESNALVDCSLFLSAGLGGDICYGEGTYNGVPCNLSSPFPGPAPAMTRGS